MKSTAVPALFASLAGVLALAAAPAAAQAHQLPPLPRLGPAHGHADFESGRFDVRVDGPRRPAGDVILISGISSSPAIWDGLTEQLKGRYRVHRIHINGFAGSPAEANATGPVSAPVAEELARYIAEQELNKPAVIGHSMGGTIGMMLAARHPDSVGKLMVVDMVPFMGAMFGPPGIPPTAENVAPVADQVHAAMLTTSDAEYRARAAATVVGMIYTETARAGPLQDAATSDRWVTAAAYRELVVTDLRAELPRITARTKVLYVAFNSPGMTPEMTDAIYRASYMSLPAAQLTRIDDSAQFIMLDQPAVFAAEVKAFLE